MSNDRIDMYESLNSSRRDTMIKLNKDDRRKTLARAAIFPLWGQIYNWKTLEISSYKKTLFFSLFFAGFLGASLYYHIRYVETSYNHQGAGREHFYSMRNYFLSFFAVINALCFFDSYSTVYMQTFDCSKDLGMVKFKKKNKNEEE